MTRRMKLGNSVNMSFASGVCELCVQVAEKRKWMLSWPLCCTIIESWFVIAWSWAPLPRLQANGGPCRAGDPIKGPFLGGRLLSSKQPEPPRDGTRRTTDGPQTGQPASQRTLGALHCTALRCKHCSSLQVCGVQARPVFQAPGTRPAESHA